jgi:DNA-binding CsgD family transcriptional regulator
MSRINHRDYLDVHEAPSRLDLERRLLDFCERMGFERFTAMLSSSQPAEKKFKSILSNVPDAFREMSLDTEAAARCPVFQRFSRESIPFWYDQSTYLASGAADLWEQQAPFGYKTGVCVGLHNWSGIDFIFGFDRSRPLGPGGAPRARLLADLCLLAAYTQEAACKILMPTSSALTARPDLSARELEVLRWVRDGKSAWAIGKILRISEHTVRAHMANGRSKLQTTSTLAAAMRAYDLGLLHPQFPRL